MGRIMQRRIGTKIVCHTNKDYQSKDISEILSSDSWSGRRCIIIGGGPSLQNFNRSIVKNELTIGVNKEFMFSTPTINYSMDYTFFELLNNNQRIDPEEILMRRLWREYKGIKVFLKKNKGKFSNYVYTINRIRKEIISVDLKDGIYGGNNSGLGAVMLAIALGSRNIGLLGFDMKIVNGKTHCHGGYKRGNGKPKHDMESTARILNDFKVRFETVAVLIKQAGVKVFNLNQNSAINCFPKITLQKFLKGK